MKRCLLLFSWLIVTTTMFGSELSNTMSVEDAYKVFNQKDCLTIHQDKINFFDVTIDILIDSFILTKDQSDFKYKDIFKNREIEYLEVLARTGDIDTQSDNALIENTFKQVQYWMEDFKRLEQDYENIANDGCTFEGLLQFESSVDALQKQAKMIDKPFWTKNFKNKLSKIISNLKNKVEDVYRKNEVTYSWSSFFFKSYTTKIAGLFSVCGVAGYAIVKLYRKYNTQKTHAKRTKIKATIEPETAFVVG